MPFPPDFTWGVSAAAYQIEGAARADGKGPSVWDDFCRRPGAVWRGQTGDTACDHYHRCAEDVGLMAELGVSAYRLSVSWPRVMPNGTGSPNEAGLAFYEHLVDALLEHGIQPWITLFHWDYPQALYRRGGWLNGDSPDWFADYARLLCERLGDRVKHWITLNEPQCFIGLGHQSGQHAPGLRLSLPDVLLAGHRALLAHGKAVQALRATSPGPCSIGYAPCSKVKCPVEDVPENRAAAREAMFTMQDAGIFNNAYWMDPVYLGRYPDEATDIYGCAMPAVAEGDMDIIAQPLDFFGINIYSGERFEAGPDGKPQFVEPVPGYPKTTQDFWHIVPEALYWGPRFYYERYRLPVVITENGHQNADVISLDGRCHDPQRIDYLQRYLLELRRAADDGIPVAGYFQWTLMDNFEWAFGYAVRVGLVHTDYVTLRRTPKDSYYWYRRLIQTNGRSLDETP